MRHLRNVGVSRGVARKDTENVKRLRLDIHTVTKATSWNSGPIPRSIERLLITARHWAFQSYLERKVTRNNNNKKRKSEQKHSIMLCVCRTRSQHQKLRLPC